MNTFSNTAYTSRGEFGNPQPAIDHCRGAGRHQGARHPGVRHHRRLAGVRSCDPRHRRCGAPDQGDGHACDRPGQTGRRSDCQHGRRRQRRMGAGRLRRCDRAHHAAGGAPVLQPRRVVGPEARQSADRRGKSACQRSGGGEEGGGRGGDAGTEGQGRPRGQGGGQARGSQGGGREGGQEGRSRQSGGEKSPCRGGICRHVEKGGGRKGACQIGGQEGRCEEAGKWQAGSQ